MKQTILLKITSRKFLLTVGAVCTALGGALSGQLPWTQAVWGIIVAVLGYTGIEGARDIRATIPRRSATVAPPGAPLEW